MKKTLLAAGSIGSLLLPFIAFAQNFDGAYVTSVTEFIKTILSWAIPVVITILVLVFFYELYQFISAAPDKKAERRSGVLYSVLALFIAISIFGIISILQKITGTDQGNVLDGNTLPTITF